jgi:hypothetical protein
LFHELVYVIILLEVKHIMAYCTDSLESVDNPRVLFRGIVGSRAYGTQNEYSDYDVRGFYVRPLEWYLQLREGLPDTIVESLAQECLGGAGVQESGRAVSVALNGI